MGSCTACYTLNLMGTTNSVNFVVTLCTIPISHRVTCHHSTWMIEVSDFISVRVVGTFQMDEDLAQLIQMPLIHIHKPGIGHTRSAEMIATPKVAPSEATGLFMRHGKEHVLGITILPRNIGAPRVAVKLQGEVIICEVITPRSDHAT